LKNNNTSIKAFTTPLVKGSKNVHISWNITHNSSFNLAQVHATVFDCASIQFANLPPSCVVSTNAF
jgi:hypothetical protein